mgnify:CR=1 FL=1
MIEDEDDEDDGPGSGTLAEDSDEIGDEDDEGDDLAVHAPIIAHSPGNATPCTGFHAHSCAPNPLPPMHLGHRRS